MPSLLLELFSEEIPARMQARASGDLKRLVTEALVSAGLVYEAAEAFATPRRLALAVHGLSARSPDQREERKGPRVDAPEAAISGFLKSAGLSARSDARILHDPKRGDFLVADIVKPGRPAKDIIAESIPAVIQAFPWPKSMRWGTGSLRWVRPLHRLLCLFLQEHEPPEVVDFAVDGIRAGALTEGHRFLAPQAFTVRDFDDYMRGLRAAKVVLDPDLRRDIIAADASHLAFAARLILVRDDALLQEVAGLVEWPVVLIGSFDPAFLALPDVVIRATIRAHQKCFVLQDPASGRLANRFVMVANTEAKDGGATIVAGNERVIGARLADATFFFEGDLRQRLEERLAKLDDITFHEKLGSQGARVRHLIRLARMLAPLVGADPQKAERAARLAKADLVTGMVGEFPELQGVMGQIYALRQGEDPAVAEAIAAHYRPQGPSEAVPSDPVSIAVALADKIVLLAGFWAIGEKPTGSKDPFALRRAGLGIVRIMIENRLVLPLTPVLVDAMDALAHAGIVDPGTPEQGPEHLARSLVDFLKERLRVQLLEQGMRHDLIDAVFALPGLDDLFTAVRRLRALEEMLGTHDGENLLALYRRAVNIVNAETRKGSAVTAPLDPNVFVVPEEKALHDALERVRKNSKAALEESDFHAALMALAALRKPVDDFFDKVLVNDPNARIRENRLALLQELRRACEVLADFSKIEG